MSDLEFFEFFLPDGSKRRLTIHHARSFGCRKMNERCDGILADKERQKKKLRSRDGFVPGWQPNINKFITCYAQYQRALKDLGLTEIGNQRFVPPPAPEFNPFTEEVVREAVKVGIELSGNEINALESGEYFKD